MNRTLQHSWCRVTRSRTITQCINQSINQKIKQATRPSIYQSHRSINQSINHSKLSYRTFSSVSETQSSSHSSSQSVNQSTNQSVNPKQKYSATLCLPVTTFPTFWDPVTEEPKLLDRLNDRLYIAQQIRSINRAIDQSVEQSISQSTNQSVSQSIRQSVFRLHDGPPFANGKLHIGHFLNKTLKDIINRFNVLNDRLVDYTPGWDCHGLPIEAKALETLKKSANQSINQSMSALNNQSVDQSISQSADQLSPLAIRSLCQSFAARAIEDQKSEFQRYGIMANWNQSINQKVNQLFDQSIELLKTQGLNAENAQSIKQSINQFADQIFNQSDASSTTMQPVDQSISQSIDQSTNQSINQSINNHSINQSDPSLPEPTNIYKTMTPSYEQSQLQVFRGLFEKQILRRTFKPVHWSFGSKTALAEAELEYVDNHISPSVHVLFKIQQLSKEAVEDGFSLTDNHQPINQSINQSDNHLHALVWTTTPWTLPANQAIAVHPKLEYAQVRIGELIDESVDQAINQPIIDLSKSNGSTIQPIKIFTVQGDNIDVSIHEPVTQSIDQSINQSADQSVNQSVSQSTNQSPKPVKKLKPELFDLTGVNVLIGVDRLTELQSLIGRRLTILACTTGSRLVGTASTDQSINQSMSQSSYLHPVTGEMIHSPIQQSVDQSTNQSINQTIYSHLLTDELLPFISGDHVTNDSGTALVHTAPAHGIDDYHCMQNQSISQSINQSTNQANKFIISIVDDAGNYSNISSSNQSINQLTGLSVLTDGNEGVIKLLRENRKLFYFTRLTHRFPYDWRSKTPVIQRATKQWFASIDELINQSINALSDVKFYPSAGHSRLQGTLSSRKEWCISRQRCWGVPIPVFYDENDTPLMTVETIDHVSEVFGKHGSNHWWSATVADLLPTKYKDVAHRYTKGMDTLDVWFDSGCSWANPINNNSKALQLMESINQSINHTTNQSINQSNNPIINQLNNQSINQFDVYLEGSDQHRGWFQSSLLLSVALMGRAPYQSIITHGFVLDENMRKMSKSLGNVMEPRQLIDPKFGKPAITVSPVTSTPDQSINQSIDQAPVKLSKRAQKRIANPSRSSTASAQPVLGADVLRLWVASTTYQSDTSIGMVGLQTVSEVHRKIRSSFRFLLGCTFDFDVTKKVSINDMSLMDQAMMYSLHQLTERVNAAYASYDLVTLYQCLNAFNVSELSSWYFDVSKDRLYVEASDSHSRRACQTVLMHIMEVFLKAWAPVVCFTSQAVWQHMTPQQRAFISDDVHTESVFLTSWIRPAFDMSDTLETCATSYELVEWSRKLKSEVSKALELSRRAQTIGSSLDAAVTLYVPNQAVNVKEQIERLGDELQTILVVSSLDVQYAEDVNTSIASVADDATNMLTFTLNDTLLACHVRRVNGCKCPRCWKYHGSNVSDDASTDPLCQRCESVMNAVQ